MQKIQEKGQPHGSVKILGGRPFVALLVYAVSDC